MILKGDCIEIMKAIKPNSVDAIVCDPPYGLEFMGKQWDRLQGKFEVGMKLTGSGNPCNRLPSPSYLNPQKNIKCPDCGQWLNGRDPNKPNKRKGYKCTCGGAKRIFYSMAVNSMQLWHTQWLTEAYRVLKPGGSMLVMGGTRTSHRLACAIEDSGFIIKDTLMWIYGSGFPKAQDLGKMIDKRNGRNPCWQFKDYLNKRRVEKGLSFNQINEMLDMAITGGGTASSIMGDKLYNVLPTLEIYRKLKEILALDNKFDKLIEREEAERKIIGIQYKRTKQNWMPNSKDNNTYISNPVTDLAKHWDGFKVGGIKPAFEPILWAIKDLKIEPKYSIINKINKSLGDILWHSLVESISKDTSKLQEMVSIALNIALLWNAILGEVLKSGNKFTTSTESKLITELKILNSLLLANTLEIMGGESQIYQNGTVRSQANGLRSVVKIVTEYLEDGKKNIKHIQNAIAQENAIYKQNKNGISAQNAEKDLQPIILSVFIALKYVLTGLSAGGNGKELKELVNIAEEYLKQSLHSQQSSVTESAWLNNIKKISPDFSPIIWAVKPPEGSYVDNVLKWGVGAVNVDECRVGYQGNCDRELAHKNALGPIERYKTHKQIYGGGRKSAGFKDTHSPKGRFPANVILSHHPECVQVGMKKVRGNGHFPREQIESYTGKHGIYGKRAKKLSPEKYFNIEQVESWDCHPDCAVRLLDEQSGVSKSIMHKNKPSGSSTGTFGMGIKEAHSNHNDSGGASRFFYCAKSSRTERNAMIKMLFWLDGKQIEKELHDKLEAENEINKDNDNFIPHKIQQGNIHPTCKPVSLFEHLIKLVTRQGQIILDPFIGSGTTAIAAHNVGRKCVGIEKEDEYLEIAKRRIDYWKNQPKQMEMGL